MIMGVYKITSPSGKIYIGQSVDILLRWEKDYKKARCKNQTKLYNSLIKYGWDSHEKEIIEECIESQLIERETYWKLFYRVLEVPSLCCRIDGKGGKMSQETKDKIRDHHLNNPLSQDALDRISKAHKGLKYSDESKAKISTSKTGHPMYSEEWKKKISESLQNMDECSKLNKAKSISDKTKGKPKPNGFGYIVSKIHKGRKNSEETKQKIRQNKIGTGTKPIIQYELDGKFVKEWNSASEAEQFFRPGTKNRDNIGGNCRGIKKTAYGFIFKFK